MSISQVSGCATMSCRKFENNTVIIAVVSSNTKTKSKLPTHFFIKAQQGLRRDSIVLLEQIRTIDKKRLTEYIGTLDIKIMKAIDAALAISVGLKQGDAK